MQLPKAAMLLASALLAGCFDGGGRVAQPELNLDPSSALQGAVLVVNMSAQDVRFDECPNLLDPASAVGAVIFHTPIHLTAPPAGEVTVYVAKPVSAHVLRVEIAVDASAATGDYQVEVICGGRAPLQGSFRVRERKEGPVLDLSPGSAAAGTTNLAVAFSVTGAEFVPGASHVTFGSGSHVAVKQQIHLSATEMMTTIDIGPGAPLGSMEVTVTSGGMVARGAFEIEERIYPAVQAFPDQVYRPTIGDPPTQATLLVLGSGVNFSAGDPEDDEAAKTEVSFPLNPGITVTSVVVEEADVLTVNILVDSLALLGPTLLEVTTGEEQAVTDFTVLVTTDTPVLKISPSAIVRGAEASLFLLQAVNFAFEEPLEVAFASPGCRVDAFQVLPSSGPPQAMVLSIEADAGFPGNGNVLVITSAGFAVAVHLAVVDPDAPLLASPSPSSFAQGSIGFAVLTFQEAGSFSPAARAEVLLRSGMRIPYQSPAVDGTSLTLQLEVAADAPLGPALLRVVDGEDVHETFAEVTSSGLAPAVALSPHVVLPGRRTVVLEAQAVGLDFAVGPVNVAFDDPGLEIAAIQTIDAQRMALTLEVNPTCRDDIAVAYFFDGNGSRAAATLRRLPSFAGVAEAVPTSVLRSVAGEQVVAVSLRGDTFGSTVAQILAGIGIDVKRVTVTSPTTLDLVLELEADGPGGWIGLLLKTGARQVVVPLHVSGSDESLTLQLAPSQLRPGANAETVIATAPSGYAAFDPIFTTAAAGTEGAHAAIGAVLSGLQSSLLIDISHDLAIGTPGLPVLITATKGAYAGFLSVAPLLTGTAAPSSPWQGTLALGETRLVTVDGGTPPTVVLPSTGDPNHADIRTALVDERGVVATPGLPPHGLTWVVEDNGVRVTVDLDGDTGGGSSVLDVWPVGERAIQLIEPDDTPSLATPVGNPCAGPLLARGAIDLGLDVDRLRLDAAPCDLAAVIISRSLAPRPWHTPDCRLERRSATNVLLEYATGGTHSDPRLYLVDAPDGEQLLISGEMGTTGAYLLNIRRAAVITELGTSADSPFVELSVPPGAALDGLVLELLDGGSGLVLASLDLTGQVAGDSGIFVIGGASMTGADLNHPVAELPDSGSFALRLLAGGELSDAVQVGGDGTYGEGDPLDRADGPCFFRPGTIDTDWNRADFIPTWIATPGTE